MFAGETTHSTDQPDDKAVTPVNTSSKVIPENKATSKAEYTNTQQGLPVSGYTLVRYLDMQDFLAGGGLFCRKAPKIRSIISDFSFPYSSLINHSK